MLADTVCSKRIILRESRRKNPTYSQHALSCLAEYVELRDSIHLAAEVYEVTTPIIKDLLAGPEEMDLDMQPGDLPSKTMYGFTAKVQHNRGICLLNGGIGKRIL